MRENGLQLMKMMIHSLINEEKITVTDVDGKEIKKVVVIDSLEMDGLPRRIKMYFLVEGLSQCLKLQKME